jgi:dTDP-4-amino-4,6-dideoxygalactose transaminase
MQRAIPFTKVHIGEEEKAAVLQALEAGALGGNGPIGAEFQRSLREGLGVRHVLLTTSGSHALELAVMALRLKPGDEVILPSFTFVTTASSIVRQGARPIFVDIDEATFNLDPAQIEAHLTPRTRAIMPVHYAGQGCAMDVIMAIAQKHSLYVIEDAAQGLGARFAGRPLGTFGQAGCFSFHVTKNIICGEGGFLATNDDAVAERAEIQREKGTNRSKFLRGEVDKYTWVDVGSSFVPSDLLAAVAQAQFRKIDAIHAQRRRVWEQYHAGLAELERRGALFRPVVHPQAELNWHLYAFRIADAARRDDVLAALKRRGIGATFHYIPLHSSPYAMEQWGYRPEDLPVTERVAAALIRLPLFPDLSSDDVEYILASLYEVLRVNA